MMIEISTFLFSNNTFLLTISFFDFKNNLIDNNNGSGYFLYTNSLKNQARENVLRQMIDNQ